MNMLNYMVCVCSPLLCRVTVQIQDRLPNVLDVYTAGFDFVLYILEAFAVCPVFGVCLANELCVRRYLATNHRRRRR